MIRAYQAAVANSVVDPAPARRQAMLRDRMAALMAISAIAALAALLQGFNTTPAPSGSATPNAGASFVAR